MPVRHHVLQPQLRGHAGSRGLHAMAACPFGAATPARAADGSSGECVGRIPSVRPDAPGWTPPRVSTHGNQRTQTDVDPVPLTHSWCSPDRFQRIRQILNAPAHMAPRPEPHPDGRPVAPGQRVVPMVLPTPYTARMPYWAARTLTGWNFRMTTGSTAALVFGVLMTGSGAAFWPRGLWESTPAFYTPPRGTCTTPWTGWRGSGPERAASGKEPGDFWGEALVRTMRFIRGALGPRRRRWSWGRLHTYTFRHLGAAGGLASWLLNRGPYPAPGSGATVNVALTNPAYRQGREPGPTERYDAGVIPSLRLVCQWRTWTGCSSRGPWANPASPGATTTTTWVLHASRGGKCRAAKPRSR